MRDAHVVIHPSFDVVRDITGELQSITAVDDGALEPEGEAVRESWMHVEIDRLPEGDDPDEIIEQLQRVLRDVRESVEDWRKMHAQVEDVVAGLRADPPPLDEEEVRQAADLLEWLAADHFTFLGYKEYRLEREGDDEYLRGRARHRARHPARRPGDVGDLRPAAGRGQGQGQGEDACWCSPRRTPAPRSTGRRTSTTSASRRSTRTATSTASGASSACSPAPPTPSR